MCIHIPGKDNHIADALSWKEQYGAFNWVNTIVDIEKVESEYFSLNFDLWGWLIAEHGQHMKEH